MDTNDLQCLLAVADTGSFSRAAERVHLSQPAVSKRIAALEHELGARLFDRVAKRVRPTEAGDALLGRARQIIAELADIRRALANLDGGIGGTLAVATSHHVGLHRLPMPLRKYHERFPAVKLDLRFMDSEAACNAVANGEIEIGIVTLPTIQRPPLRALPVWDDPLEFVVGRNHPLAARRRVTRKELLAEPAILPGGGTYTRTIILRALGASAQAISVGMATNYLEVLRMLTATGLGWSCLPRTLIDDALKVIQIEKVRVRRTLGIVTHEGRTLSNAARALIDVVRSAT